MQSILGFCRVFGSDSLYKSGDCLLNFRLEPMIDIRNVPALGITHLTGYVGDFDSCLLKVEWSRRSLYTAYQATNWVEIDPNGR